MTKQTPPVSPDHRKDYSLARVPHEDYQALMLKVETVPLKFRKRMLRQDERVDAVGTLELLFEKHAIILIAMILQEAERYMPIDAVL